MVQSVFKNADTFLFDLDGTLLPMDNDEFTGTYFRELLKKLMPFGYDKDEVIAALWKGTAAMAANDGTKTNRERFWDAFAANLGEEVRGHEKMLNRFYSEEFNKARCVSKDAGLGKRIVKTLKKKGYTVALASNAIFPYTAMCSRLSWIGLEPADFAHLTCYEESVYCKPNLEYFRQFLKVIGKEPERCVMVGNNVAEDMCASQLGIRVYLVTDFIENPSGAEYFHFTQGSLADFEALAESAGAVGKQ